MSNKITYDDEGNNVTEFEYPLSKKVRFSVVGGSGQFDQAAFITLKAPTSFQSKPCGALRQSFMRAIREQMDGNAELREAALAASDAAEAPDNEDDEDALDKDPEEEESLAQIGAQICNMVAMSSVNYDNFLEAGKMLLVSKGVASFNGGSPVKSGRVDDIAFLDLEGMIGCYIKYFINTSAQ